MDKKRNRRHRPWSGEKGGKNAKKQDAHKKPEFKYVPKEDIASVQKKNQSIREFKSREVICPICSEVITDMASAMTDKATGKPMHFECVMARLSETERLEHNEKICYIGQGRFGVLYFENPRDQKNFTIKKVIDWEEKDKRGPWRDELSGLFSQVE